MVIFHFAMLNYQRVWHMFGFSKGVYESEVDLDD